MSLLTSRHRRVTVRGQQVTEQDWTGIIAIITTLGYFENETLKMQQKWFSISASLAQTLARLVSDLEYENLRLEYEELKKQVLEGNVPSQRITLPQTGLRLPEKANGEYQI